MQTNDLIAERYRIISELGRGGMAVVYKAFDEQLARTVAIKVLHPYLADDSSNQQRFRREAQSIARLKHPNIVEVFDFTTESKNRSFIVMEYVEGVNLRDWMRDNGAPPPEIGLLIALEICRALQHAHSFGIVHRDIKPENIMISLTDGNVKLMDFGIAHVVDADTLTATGSLLGSPAHMAPEIIDAEPSDHRTDIFSIGTVIYWIISGELPFCGTSTTQLLKSILLGEYRPLICLVPKAGSEISDITSKCMCRNPEERYSTVSELITTIEHSLKNVDIDPEGNDLQLYLNDPVTYGEFFENQLVEKLRQNAHDYRSQKEIPQAIHTMNRILAYHPNYEAIARELTQLTKNSYFRWWYLVLLTLLITGIVFGIERYSTFTSQQELNSNPKNSKQQKPQLIATSRQTNQNEKPQIKQPLTNNRVNNIATQPTPSKELVPSLEAAQSATKLANQVAEEIDEQTHSIIDAGLVVVKANRPNAAKSPPVKVKKPIELQAPPQEEPPPSEPEIEEVKTFPYRFRVLPAAAQLRVDGQAVSLGEALSGIPLTEGIHVVEATSNGCKPYKIRMRVDGEQKGEPIPIILDWQNGSFQIFSNSPGVLWVGNSPTPQRFGSNGNEATISVPFGDARSLLTERKMKLTVAPIDRMQDQVVREITVRPGEKTLVNVTFPDKIQ